MASTNTPPPWPPIDPLGEALHFLRMSGVFYCRSEFSAPWGLALPPMPDCMMLHVIASGRAWLELDGEAPRPLAPGDLAVVPRGTGHRLTSQPGCCRSGPAAPSAGTSSPPIDGAPPLPAFRMPSIPEGTTRHGNAEQAGDPR